MRFATKTASMAISPLHHVFVNGIETDPSHVKLGDLLRTPHGLEPVTRIDSIEARGAYHVFVKGGSYYVDSILASDYFGLVPHMAWPLVRAYVEARYRIGVPVIPIGRGLFPATSGRSISSPDSARRYLCITPSPPSPSPRALHNRARQRCHRAPHSAARSGSNGGGRHQDGPQACVTRASRKRASRKQRVSMTHGSALGCRTRSLGVCASLHALSPARYSRRRSRPGPAGGRPPCGDITLHAVNRRPIHPLPTYLPTFFSRSRALIGIVVVCVVRGSFVVNLSQCPWSTWSAVINLTPRAGELRARPAGRTPAPWSSLVVRGSCL